MITMTRSELSAYHASLEAAILAVRAAPISRGEGLAALATLRLVQQAASMYRVSGPVERVVAGIRFSWDGERAVLSADDDGAPRALPAAAGTADVLLDAAEALIEQHVGRTDGRPDLATLAAARNAML